MRIRVLGDLQIEAADRLTTPPGGKERMLLAVLVVRLGEAVSTDTLADVLWNDGDQRPRNAVKSIQVHVTRLRATLAEKAVHTTQRGYRLEIPRSDVDAYAFEDTAGQARAALDHGEAEEAERLANNALRMWRGDPYSDFDDVSLFAVEARRLGEIRLAAYDVQLESGLALGRAAQVAAAAEALCASHPLREHFWALHITALYRTGRQSDALAACRGVRRLLADEVGADPGPELTGLEQQILHHDPGLAGQRPVSQDVFAGRAPELAWLRARWEETRERRIVVVTGPPGSGRSRLVSHFAAQLHREGITVTTGRAAPSGLVIFDGDGEPADLSAIPASAPVLCLLTGGGQAPPGQSFAELPLRPLPRAALADIAAQFLPSLTTSELDDLERDSGGWPGSARRIALDLALDRARRRVVDAADVAGPAQRTLSGARQDVAVGVQELMRLEQRAQASHEPAVCPYKGLARYEPADAWLFFGRERLVATVCARLVDTGLLAVVGPSGAGKSSLVRAGVSSHSQSPTSSPSPVSTPRPKPAIVRIEAESLAGAATLQGDRRTTVVIQDQSCCDNVRWSGGKQLFFKAYAPDAAVTMTFSVPVDGDYLLETIRTTAPDYAATAFLVDGVPVGGAFAGYSARTDDGLGRGG